MTCFLSDYNSLMTQVSNLKPQRIYSLHVNSLVHCWCAVKPSAFVEGHSSFYIYDFLIPFIGHLTYLLSTSLSVMEVWGSIPEAVKSDTVSSTVRHRCDVFSLLFCPGVKQRRRSPTRYMLRRNTANVIKI